MLCCLKCGLGRALLLQVWHDKPRNRMDERINDLRIALLLQRLHMSKEGGVCVEVSHGTPHSYHQAGVMCTHIAIQLTPAAHILVCRQLQTQS